MVSAFHAEGATAFAGSQLTLICSIVLAPSLRHFLGALVVTSVWTGPGSGMLSNGGRITVSPASLVPGSTTFTSTVLFNTLRTSDTGTYTCQATVAPLRPIEGTTNGVGSASTATPTIQGSSFVQPKAAHGPGNEASSVHKIIIKDVLRVLHT